MDYKISQLPQAIDIIGNELIEIVQDGRNKKAVASSFTQDKIIINKIDLDLIGNTILGTTYKDDKSVAQNGKLLIEVGNEYKKFNIPTLNKINDTLYDSVKGLVYTKKIQHFIIDENCVFKFGRALNGSTTFVDDSDNLFMFHVDLANMKLPNSIRDTGKILSVFPNIATWIKKEIGLNIAYPGLLTVHLDLSYFNSTTIPTTLEELKQFFANNDNKKISVYYELDLPVLYNLEPEFITTDKSTICTIMDEVYQGTKLLNKSSDLHYSIDHLSKIESKLSNKRTYYASEFGCSYSNISGVCNGIKGDKIINVPNLNSLDFEIGQGIAIENARYVRTDELSWLCATIKSIDYINKTITIDRALQENVTNVIIEHDNFVNYLRIAEFFIDKDYVDLEFETGIYLCHSLRSVNDTLKTFLSDTGIKRHEGADSRVAISLTNKKYINIDFKGSTFKEVAKWKLKADNTFGGFNRCEVLPFSFIQLMGSSKVTMKNGVVRHDSETNCIYTGISTGENMGIGFLVHGCKDVYLENLEAIGMESDGFALGGSSFIDENGVSNPTGNRHIKLYNCRAYYCGRQGLTFSSGVDGEIDLCDFSYTGYCKDGVTKSWWGCRNPGAGIDFEFESSSDSTVGWVATSAIRRIKVSNTKLVGNSYALANGMTEGNFLMENSIIIGNPTGVFLIHTGTNAGFTMRAEEDETYPYSFGTMQPITCVFRDCMIDQNGITNANSFGFFRRVIFDSCVLRNFKCSYGGRQLSILNSDLQYTDGNRGYMSGYPRFPLIQNCTVRFRKDHIDKYADWNGFACLYGQFQDCTFFLEEPSTEFTDKTKKLIVDFGKNSTRNYVYPSINYSIDGTSENPVISEKTVDWGARECYEFYSAGDFNISRIYRKDLDIKGNYVETGNVPTNYKLGSDFVVTDTAYVKKTAVLTFRGKVINHIITLKGDKNPNIEKLNIVLNSTVSFKFKNETTNFTYTIPTEYATKDLILEMKPTLTNPLIIDIKIIPDNPSIIS